MLELSRQYSTPLALDESVATLAQLQNCYEQGWRGIFVIKPAIAGFPSQLRQFCQTHPIDAVFSSVFETAIGRTTGLSLAAELTSSDRAVGFGVSHWFSDSWDQLSDFEQLWNSL
jgi:O-succinylbenzoate synthase